MLNTLNRVSFKSKTAPQDFQFCYKRKGFVFFQNKRKSLRIIIIMIIKYGYLYELDSKRSWTATQISRMKDLEHFSSSFKKITNCPEKSWWYGEHLFRVGDYRFWAESDLSDRLIITWQQYNLSIDRAIPIEILSFLPTGEVSIFTRHDPSGVDQIEEDERNQHRERVEAVLISFVVGNAAVYPARIFDESENNTNLGSSKHVSQRSKIGECI